MAQLSDTEGSYSPSSWWPHDSVLHGHDSLFDTQQINTPVPQTPLDALSEHENAVLESEKRRPRKRQRKLRSKLPLLREGEWDPDRRYDEEPPACVHYSIVWIVATNGKPKSKDTKRDLVLEPAAYWRLFLRPCLDKLVEQKYGHIRSVRAVETGVIVSTTARGEPDLTLRFDGLDIDWTDINSQLTDWSGLLEDGKKLQVELTFHYDTPEQAALNTSVLRRHGTARQTPTARMHAERSGRLRGEEETEGRASIWVEVYRDRRCPTSCPKGPHCLIDDDPDRTHYKLYTHHLRRMVKFRMEEDGSQMEAEFLRDLKLELHQEAKIADERKRKARVTADNHVHEQFLARPSAVGPGGEHKPDGLLSPVVVTDQHDIAVHKYSLYLQSIYHNADCKEAIIAAEGHVQTRMLGSDQLHRKKDSQFLQDVGVPEGIADRWVARDIKLYQKQIVQQSQA